jgi:hypothetical protein
MPQPISLDLSTTDTTMHLVGIFTATQGPLVALRDIAKPLAMKRGSEPVPAAIRDEARELLEGVRTIAGRERGVRRRLTLPDALDWTTLLAKLEFALVALAAFQRQHSAYDREFGTVVWHDEIWRDFAAHRGESANAGKALHES